MNTSDKRVTIRQVARLAGVSAMTVSKALNGKPGIAAETRERVLAAAKELRYTPNLLAKSFRTARTNTIGVIMSSSFETVFTMLLDGIEEAAAEAGYSILLATTRDDLDAEMAIIESMVRKRVDGLILTSSMVFSEKQRLLLERLGVPYILTVRSYADPTVTTVHNDNYQGSFGLVDYLAKTGSRRFLFLSMLENRCSTTERIRGWTDALKANGLRFAPGSLVYLDHVEAAGYEATAARFAKGLPYDAIVCATDLIALGAINALRDKRIEIPRQVRVAGFNGIPLCPYFRVPLTTVEQPLYEIGKTGMRLLAEKISNPAAPPQKVVLENRLVIRQST